VTGFYQRTDTTFQLFNSGTRPAWRAPQRAALGAVLAQWSLRGADDPLVSLPTGVGKTAVAIAAPYLVGANRVLVVVPTRELRRQTVDRYKTQEVLKRIGAVADAEPSPVVRQVTGLVSDWNTLTDADVVVALPSSISPAHYQRNRPATDFFDLVIVDEAHHAPATTWLAILEHFEAAHLLLTATPHRRDRKRIPGKLVYYYPLRQALDEGFYQPVTADVLDVPAGATRSTVDEMIAVETVRVLAMPEHATSQFLIRAQRKKRAMELADLYDRFGQPVDVLHSGLSGRRQTEVIDGLKAGTTRGVAMVGMLVEGFDLPSLRVAAYHDKHKSLEPTAQLIGRLARVDDAHPQPSVLVTARDIDVYPELEGAVRDLYDEDPDWASVLPGIIDAYVEQELHNADYARSFDPPTAAIDLSLVNPLRRLSFFEIRDEGWKPNFSDGSLSPELGIGGALAGRRIVYSGVNSERTTLLVITAVRDRPRWHEGEALDAMLYDLHLVSHRPSPRTDRADLLLVNAQTKALQQALVDRVGGADRVRPADPRQLQLAFDSLPRTSVSSVGVRSTYGATRGAPSYRMYAGSGIEGGLRESDTALAALGHAMVQVPGDSGSFTAGVSTGKSKYWETRYAPLRAYEQFVSGFADRYWFPPVPPSGPLLPQINRGERLARWPSGDVLAVGLDYALAGAEWSIGGVPLELFDLWAGEKARTLGASAQSPDHLELAVTRPDPSGNTVVWTGVLKLDGLVEAASSELLAQRGYGIVTPLAELLSERPPTVYFVDGTTVRGNQLYPAPAGSRTHVASDLIVTTDWEGVDLTAETYETALAHGIGMSVHERLEHFLVESPRRANHRWILSNDGHGEIADYIVLEVGDGNVVHVGLWHAKFAAGASAAARVGDFEVVSSQAIKSRRWPTDRTLWSELASRLLGKYPPLTVVDGNRRQLEVLLGLHPRWDQLSLARRKRSVRAAIFIVQPGLSQNALAAGISSGSTSAIQIAQLLNAFRDAVLEVAMPGVLASP
jgi:superfamily II DNA or RNA helicase